MSFWGAAAFQWVNPKALSMALGAIALCAPGLDTAAILIMTAVFVLVNVPPVAILTGLGTALARGLSDPARLRRFIWVMATALVASLWPVLRG